VEELMLAEVSSTRRSSFPAVNTSART